MKFLFTFFIFIFYVHGQEVASLVSQMPDFSWAGYHYGEPLPQRKSEIILPVPNKIQTEPFDITEILQTTIRNNPGKVISIPEGRWKLTQPILIQSNSTVIQGAGAAKTILVCPYSLADLKGENRNWSWSGGFFQISPLKHKSTTLGTISKAAKSGSNTLEVAFNNLTSHPLEAGEWLELHWYNDFGKDTFLSYLYRDLVPKNRLGTELQKSKGVRVKEWIQVKKSFKNTLILTQPLSLAVRPEWKPTIVRRTYITETAIEGLTFEFPKTKYPGHLKEKGYNGITVQSAINCWIRDIQTINADSGIFVGSSKCVTVEGFVCKGRKMHHPLCITWSSDCLVTQWRLEAPHRHGTTLSWGAHRNVFSEGWGKQLAMDAHRAVPFENLHTKIIIEHKKNPVQLLSFGAFNPFRSGGSYPRGYHAAKGNIYWNIENRFPAETSSSAKIRGYHEWPFAGFIYWHGNKELDMPPLKGLKQKVFGLNQKPQIENLHLYQRTNRILLKSKK